MTPNQLDPLTGKVKVNKLDSKGLIHLTRQVSVDRIFRQLQFPVELADRHQLTDAWRRMAKLLSASEKVDVSEIRVRS